MKKIIVDGDNLALARIKKGYSLQSLAEKSSVNYTTINKLENGRQKTTPETAKKLCHALETAFDDLFYIE